MPLRQYNKAIIRHFTQLCKQIFDEKTVEEIFKDVYNFYDITKARCPCCGSRKLKEKGYYGRNLTRPGKQKVTINCYRCDSCHSWHALLPDILIPHSPYNLRFRLQALQAYCNRKVSVEALCAELGIAISTLYRWLHAFEDQMALFYGLVKSLEVTTKGFIGILLQEPYLSSWLRRFFTTFGFSFWQTTTTRTKRRNNFQFEPT